MLIMNKEQKLAWQRQRRALTHNSDTKKYEKTPNGFLMRMYRNMQSRTLGIQWRKAHLYKGKGLLYREEFHEWAITHPDFWLLFNKWVDSQYDRRLTPTVNRVNSKLGYFIDNMEWITHSENSRLGAKSRNHPEQPL